VLRDAPGRGLFRPVSDWLRPESIDREFARVYAAPKRSRKFGFPAFFALAPAGKADYEFAGNLLIQFLRIEIVHPALE
jgi:hypothetical protein